MAAQKTPEQIIAAFNKKPDGSAEKAEMRNEFRNEPVIICDASGKGVDPLKTLRAVDYYKRNGRTAPGAITFDSLLAEKAPPREFDVLRRVELFDGVSPGADGERDVDWSGIDRAWKETVGYAVRYGQVPAGATSETVAGALRTGSPPSPWPEIRKEWETIKASQKAADRAKVVAVAAVMEGDFSEVASSTGPFGGSPSVSPQLASGLYQEAAVAHVAAPASARPVGVFLMYHAEDARVVARLRQHLSSMERNGMIEVISVDQIPPGFARDEVIAQMEARAQIILICISSASLASGLADRAAAFTSVGKHVIPVLLRPAAVEDYAVGRLSQLPANKVPVSKWSSEDDALYDIASGVRKTANTIRGN